MKYEELIQALRGEDITDVRGMMDYAVTPSTEGVE